MDDLDTADFHGLLSYSEREEDLRLSLMSPDHVLNETIWTANTYQK